ncbi:MAG: GH3 auxin-responsive promoter family protein [Crocinitomicaceae bacterium]|jgi:acyl-CoA synthetase (AMP-forming)/AMP-acid ligase II|nr:GH3 auxin-responsive promoter family protein [Crocinitomicaceae bacterium]
MPIIGKFIKNTTKISYKRSIRKSKEFYHQVVTLVKLLEKANKTQFGRVYSFNSILNDDDIIESFQRNVPITNYTEFYDKWLENCIQGKRDIIWPGRIRHYALSSGTTGSPSKRIPVTTNMIRSFQRTSIKQLSTLHNLDLPEEFFQASVLAVGGSTKLVKGPTHIEGDLSGILKKYTSPLAAPFAKPGKKITHLKNWNEKLELMIQRAPDWNIGIMAGVPSWCIMLLEKIVERYQLNSIHDIWPNFQVYVHGGVYMAPYMSRFKKVLGKEVYTLDTYLASEGYFAYQVAPDREGMELLLKNGAFFEFVPFNSDYFNADGNLINNYNALALNEVEPNTDYALVISTNAGLWRYMIGDLVRFVDTASHEIVISGRIKQYLSIVGEHLSLENINMAIQKVSEKRGLEISEFTIHVVEGELQHHWYVGVDEEVNKEELMREIDAEICALNDDYAAVRKYTLKDPLITVLPNEEFYKFLSHLGKAGSQNKFPRVLNTEQRPKWVEYLKEKNLG